ncbi:MAG TPA: hypothetical protein VFH48_15455 [Chloroflexota bacterium]|nr:hypothetical protein [Chloroflexota bacterium]
MDIASVLSAAAASTAAVLAGINLIVSGRREDRRYARDVATEALVTYMHASFEIGVACREIVKIRGEGGPDERQEHERRIEDAHDTQMQNLTRLRLLSTRQVVEAAQRMHELGDEITELSLGDGDAEAIRRVKERLDSARTEMVIASRRAIDVPDPTGTSLAFS